MRNRLIVICATLIQSFVCQGQQEYHLPAKSFIHDIPGDNFITLHNKIGIIYINEWNLSGEIVWSDSISTGIDREYAASLELEQFGSTGSYRLFACMRQQSSSSSTAIIYQTTLELSSREFHHPRIDTMTASFVMSTSISDTEQYLFTHSVSASTHRKRMHDVYSVTPEGGLSLIKAGIVSDPVIETEWKFEYLDGGIYQLHSDYGEVFSRRYNLAMEPVSDTNRSACVDRYELGETVLKHLKNKDSLFVFFYSYNWAIKTDAWTFAWLTPDMQELKSKHVLFDQQLGAYYSAIVEAVVMTSDRIYVYADVHNSDVPLPSGTKKLFVFDHKFKLICDRLNTNGKGSEETVKLLNNRAYASFSSSDGIHLVWLDGCKVGLDEIDGRFVELFPNPIKNTLTLKTSENVLGHEAIIISLTGQEAARYSLSSPHENTWSVDLQSGVYLLQIGDNGQPTRLVVE